MRNEWLNRAIFYEIYPTSFCDSNADGIGDINGIIGKLDYIMELGCTAIWLNPCYTSPFQDGGYDVSDYYKVDTRFGTNEDMKCLFDECHKRGIKILLDLVMGHTSHEHEWFKHSCKEERNEFTDAYIWSDHMDVEHCEGRFMCGLSERPHMFKVNYYATQPALNYGYYRPKESWQMAMDSPAAKASTKRMLDVCRFWLSMGADGFRVDMAHAMIKNDINHRGTIKFWKDFFKEIRRDFPESVWLAEWSHPFQTIRQAGFDLDFFTPFGLYTMFSYERDDKTVYSNTYISEKSKNFKRFIVAMKYMNTVIRNSDGQFIISLDNHDTIRLSRGRSDEMIKVLWASYLTLPNIPLIYYGDEIGMRYQPLKSKDGGYHRTGSRTPMQWDNSKNLGFSKTDGELYLPTEKQDTRYTVEAQKKDKNSIYNTVKQLIIIRNSLDCMNAKSKFKILSIGRNCNGNPFIYKRESEKDEAIIVLVPRKASLDVNMKRYIKGEWNSIMQNAELKNNILHCSGTSFAVFYKNK